MANIDTYSLSDLVAQNITASVADYGMDALLTAVQARMAFLNSSVAEQMSVFAEMSTDARRLWGSSDNFAMEEVDEYGVAKSQKGAVGVEVGFPLRKFVLAVASSKDWYYRRSVSEFAKRAMNVENAYLKRIQDELAFAIFNNVNYSVKDYLLDNTTLNVKAFLNADSSVIPDAPNGTSFTGSTHNHYKGTAGAALAASDVDALIANVTEHGNFGVKLFIPAALVSTLEGLASTKFVKVSMVGIINPTDVASTVSAVDMASTDPENRLAGYWEGVPVFTRSWVKTSMIVCVASNAMGQMPLLFRQDPVAGLRGLHIEAEQVNHPIMATTWGANFGIAPWNRSAVAVLDSAHQTNYTKPTLIR